MIKLDLYIRKAVSLKWITSNFVLLPKMTANSLRRSANTQPGAPALVEFKNFRFLIVNKPNQASLPSFVKVNLLQEHLVILLNKHAFTGSLLVYNNNPKACHHLVRICCVILTHEF